MLMLRMTKLLLLIVPATAAADAAAVATADAANVVTADAANVVTADADVDIETGLILLLLMLL